MNGLGTTEASEAAAVEAAEERAGRTSVITEVETSGVAGAVTTSAGMVGDGLAVGS